MTVLQTDAPRDAARAPTRLPTPLPRFALAALAGAGFVAALGVWMGAVALAVGTAILCYVAAAVLAGGIMARSYPHEALGFGNLVTLGRLAIVAALIVPLFGAAGLQWTVFTMAAVALVLDGIDGWLARRQGLTSRFGARFDMEVDAALALLLALNAYAAGTMGIWIVALAAPRYLFGVAGMVLPWLNGPLPESFARKLVCVIQIGVLVGLQPPILPTQLATAAVVLAVLALAWSFGRDALWLWRQRA